MKGIVEGYYQFCIWVMRFAYVNILWVAFTLLGLIFLGFMPATVAMFSVVRKWVRGQTEIEIFATFWKSFRQEFIKSNILGYILFIIGYILSIELQILQTQEKTFYMIMSFGVFAIIILYSVIVLYFFPIFVHFNLTVTEYIKWPFIIGIIHPILTLFLMVSIVLINYITFMTIPALVFFFGGSVTAFIIMWGATKTFTKYEHVETG